MPDGGPSAPSQSNHKNIFSNAVKCLNFKKICNITYWLQSLILTCNFKSLLTAKPHLSTWGIAHVSVLLAQIPAAPDSSSLCLFQAKVWPNSTPKEWTQVLIFLAQCFPNCWGHETLPQQWWAVDTSVTYTVCPGEDLQQDHYPIFTDIIRLCGSRQGRKVKTKLRMLEELPWRWQLDTTTTSRSFYSCIHAKYFLFCYICMYTFIMNLCSIIFFQV